MPYRFVPVNPGSDFAQAMAVINGNFAQLDQEAVTKTFKQANGDAVIIGRLPSGGYGLIVYDPDGVPQVIIGQLPDGTSGIAVGKPGVDVTTAFS